MVWQQILPWTYNCNLIAWTVGASDDPCLDQCIFVLPDTHCKILAISQDIVYLQYKPKGRKQMPKHMSLAMTVLHLAQLTLNG